MTPNRWRCARECPLPLPRPQVGSTGRVHHAWQEGHVRVLRPVRRDATGGDVMNRPEYDRPNGAAVVASVIVVGFVAGSVLFVLYVLGRAIVQAVIGS